MFFLLSTPQYSNKQTNTTKVKVHLKNGIAEILDKHQDLMGLVDSDLVEVETNSDNKTEKFTFILQNAVFVVSNGGIDDTIDTTAIYVYAKQALEVKNISIEEITNECAIQEAAIIEETAKLSDKDEQNMNRVLNSRILLLQEDVDFYKKVLLKLKK